MWKYLLLLAVLVGVFLWITRAKRGSSKNEGNNTHRCDRDGLGRSPHHRAAAQPLVPCAHCGVYVPVDEAVREGELSYCCDEHRRLGPKSSSR